MGRVLGMIAAAMLAGGCAKGLRVDSAGEQGLPPPGVGVPATGPAVFDHGVVRAFHRCNASAPPTLSILMEATGQSVRWVEIDLLHGPTDGVPRAFTVGGTSPHWCGLRCSGTVWLEALEAGRRARGRYRLVLDDGGTVVESFDVPWEGGQWGVMECPTSPGGHGQR